MQAAIRVSERAVPKWWWTLKRAIDLVLGLVLLLLATPFIAIAAFGIVLVTGGSPVFAQERVGQTAGASRCSSCARW